MLITEAINTSLTDLERSDQTIKTYRLALRDFAKYLDNQGTSDVSTLKIQHFIDYALQLGRHDYSKSTMQTYVSGVAYLLNWLMLSNILHPSENDMARFKDARKTINKKRKSRMKKVPSVDTVSRMLEAAQNQDIRSPIKERDIAMIDLLHTSGCRVSDIVSLSVKDIDLVRCRAIVIGKGDKERVIKFSSNTAKSIQDYWTKRRWYEPDDPAFANHSRVVSIRHVFLTISTVENVVKTIRNIACVEGITPHRFRNHFITTVYRKTHDIYLAQKLAGHESIVTTRGYMELEDEEVDTGYSEVNFD